jgi:two-component system response regulator (stage 0 sporulation protein F)
MNKIKVLYVDDEQTNLKLFFQMFKKKFDVFTEISAEKGLSALKNNEDIDVIISDMKMPGMNGLEFIKAAKEIYSSKQFFILSGYDVSDDIRNAINNNIIKDYFKKPINIKEIETAIFNN